MRPRHPIVCIDARPTPRARQAEAAGRDLAVIAAAITTASLLVILLLVRASR